MADTNDAIAKLRAAWACPDCGCAWGETVMATGEIQCNKCAKCGLCGLRALKFTLPGSITNRASMGRAVQDPPTILYDIPRNVPCLKATLHARGECCACTRCRKTVVTWPKAGWPEVEEGAKIENGKLYCKGCATLCNCGKQGCKGHDEHEDCPVCKKRVDHLPANNQHIALVTDHAGETVRVHRKCSDCVGCGKPAAPGVCGGGVITAEGRVYHKRCAPCHVCGKRAPGDGAKWRKLGTSRKPLPYGMVHALCLAELVVEAREPPRKKAKKS